MVFKHRYVQIDENNRVKSFGNTYIEGVTIDTKVYSIPEKPEGNCDLYFIEGSFVWVEGESIPELPLTEQEQAILETAINTEYLVCLADMGI